MKAPSIKATLVAISLVAGVSAACAQVPPPAGNISYQRHPNLAAAQEKIYEAFNLISQAQAQNQYQLGGHADYAKRLLDQAANELKAAALTANAEGR